jgi:hypothetical protein
VSSALYGGNQGMSRRLLKLGGGSVTQFLTSSAFQPRVSETATAYAAPGTTISSRPGVYYPPHATFSSAAVRPSC